MGPEARAPISGARAPFIIAMPYVDTLTRRRSAEPACQALRLVSAR